MILIMKPLNPIRSAGFVLLCLIRITCVPIVDSAKVKPNVIQGIHWIYKLQEELVYDKDALDVLNAIETLAPNAYTLDSGDIKSLTTPCKGDVECEKKKKAPVMQYNLKVECIQCMNAALMKIIVSKVFEEDQSVKRQYFLKKLSRERTNQNKQMVLRMLGLLYFLKTNTHNYLWLYILRVLGAENEAVFKEVVKDGKTKKTLEDEMAQHLHLCRQNGYLPTNFGQTPANRVDEISRVAVFGRKLYEVNQPDYPFLKVVYEFAEQFDFSYLTLSKTYDKEDQLMKESGIKVNWEDTKLLMNVNKPTDPRNFILRPFEYTVYQRSALLVVRASVLYLAWIHCAKLKSMLDQTLTSVSIDSSTAGKLNTFRKHLTELLPVAVRVLGLDDPVFVNVIVNLDINIRHDVDFVTSFASQMEAMNREMQNIVLEDLQQLGVAPDHAQRLFEQPTVVRLEENVSETRFLEHVCKLENYAATIQGIMDPVSFDFVKYFLAGKSKLYETFYFNHSS